jgi:hypothetical protein
MEREEILAVYEAGPEAVIILIEHLAAIIAKLEEHIKSLEERLNKNSHNSSKPLQLMFIQLKNPIQKVGVKRVERRQEVKMAIQGQH